MKTHLLLIFLTVFLVSCQNNQKNIKEDYYAKLDKFRNNKEIELNQYVSIIKESFKGIETDGPLITAFSELNNIYTTIKTKKDVKISSTYEELEKNILNSYFDRFMLFDDLLFINLDGDVFYSLKKEEPILKNLFSEEYRDTALSKSLIENPLNIAVDFDFFISNKPSSFFIYPVLHEKKHIGWCAFQFQSNKLERLFPLDKDLGATGEVFMVNKHNYMLTNSFFSPESSVLKQQLANENISQKFIEGRGHKEIVDYRGNKALTSFEVYSIFNLDWLLVAKIDLNEIISLEYLKNPNYFYNQIKEKTISRNITYLNEILDFSTENEVSLDDFNRVDDSGTLFTHGVSTCTAVLVTLPGDFSYLAHISAYDALYKGTSTDLMSNIFKRIKKYEIPDNQLQQLKIYIITPQIQFSENIISHIMKHGIFLSQIHLLENRFSNYANIYHNLNVDETYVEWHLKDGKTKLENVDMISNVGELVSPLMFNR